MIKTSSHKYISIQGARVHNLQNIDVQIPRGSLTAITGISGSGKSSLAFDTIFAEGQRRYIESLSSFARQFLGILEKPDVDKIEGLSPALSIDQKTTVRSPRSTVGTMSEVYDYLRILFSNIGVSYCQLCGTKMTRQEYNINDNKSKSKKTKTSKSSHYHFICPKDQSILEEITVSSFSFNSPSGACSGCQGLGKRLEVDQEQIMPNPRLTINEGAIRPWQRVNAGLKWQKDALKHLVEKHKISLDIPVGKLSKSQYQILLHGDGELVGVLDQIMSRYKKTDSDFIKRELEKFMVERICPVCQGSRVKSEINHIKIDQYNILDLCSMTLEQLHSLFLKLLSNDKILSSRDRSVGDQLMVEITKRLSFLINVGLSYLTLGRDAQTLSGGEAQRIRLASQLGSQLVGVIYILDEPSIGLHPRDHNKLLESIKLLKEGENTVIIVEHDRDTIKTADYIIDIGPGAGELGGKVVVAGPIDKVMQSKRSITIDYLTGKRKVETPLKRRKYNGKNIKIVGATANNLKNIDVEIPLELMTCVTGVSGSGKSTLVKDILARALSKHFHRAKAKPLAHKSIEGLELIDKVIVVDQSPIGKNIRSNPATYTGLFGPLRELYADLPEAKNNKLSPAHFSFNLKGGRCENCHGDGLIRFEMHFLPNVFVTCEVCNGRRYLDNILHITYQGKTIADVLDMSVDTAFKFFTDQPEIQDKLKVLQKVGLGYLKLGQPAPELSGGEAQRVKLATELTRPSTGKTLYILDEPTTGLHFEDIKKLLKVLHALVDRGNTVLIVEHNHDVIKNADWIIDLGPEGGEMGGEIVFEGTPEDIIKSKVSFTGQHLKPILESR